MYGDGNYIEHDRKKSYTRLTVLSATPGLIQAEVECLHKGCRDNGPDEFSVPNALDLETTCVCKPAPFLAFKHLKLRHLPAKFQRFVLSQCDVAPSFWIGAKDLYQAFSSWASRTGSPSSTAREFADVLGMAYCRQNYRSGRVRYVGLQLKTAAEAAMRDHKPVPRLQAQRKPATAAGQATARPAAGASSAGLRAAARQTDVADAVPTARSSPMDIADAVPASQTASAIQKPTSSQQGPHTAP